MKARDIALLLSDVDGTLVTEQKVLTQRAIAAVAGLRAKGIRFAITSARPPRGMAMLFDPLELQTPVAGFNGGVYATRDLATRDLKVLERKTLPADLARRAVDFLRQKNVDVWLFSGDDWFVTRLDGPHVEHERATVQFAPKVLENFDGRLDAAEKIVGVSNDHDLLRRCEEEAQQDFGAQTNARRSQPYYFDVTSKEANKGAVADFLSAHLGVSREKIATIGDQRNDLAMFARSGFSIAMGNAPDEVKARADAVTDSCNDEGFAKAVEQFFLEKST